MFPVFNEKNQLIIGGFEPFTTIDLPIVSMASIVFCQGCIWRCPYCQNKALQPMDGRAVSWNWVFDQIKARKGFIEGVVFSGGEPLIQADALAPAMAQVQDIGMKVGLHTSGCLPKALRSLLPWLDWVGLDVKAPFDQYEKVTKVPQSGQAVKKSLQILRQSDVPFECRTTVDPDFLTVQDVQKIATDLNSHHVEIYALQECLDDNRQKKFSQCFQESVLSKLRPLFPNFIVRKSNF